MTKVINPNAQGGEARDGFTFNPENLEIQDLYVTAVQGDSGYESARIFSNGVMTCKLILTYNYRYETDDFPDMSDDEIKNTIKAQTEPYLQNKNNLEIFERAYAWVDITDIGAGWTKSFSDNGNYLHDLDNASYLPNPANQRDIPEFSGIQKDNVYPIGATTANFTMAIYVSPPRRKQVTYTLGARHSYTDGNGNLQTQVTEKLVSLKSEIFSLNKDDLEFKQVNATSNSLTIIDEVHTLYDHPTSILFSLSYKGDKYGAARLNRISRYVGVVLHPTNTNVCLIHAYHHTLTGIFYYPSAHAGNQLFAGEEGTEYKNAKLLNTDLDNYNDIICQGSYWGAIQEFSIETVKAAHELGIPVVVIHRTGEPKPLSNSSLERLEDPQYFIMRDNCGNEISVRFHGLNDTDETGEYINNRTIRGTSNGESTSYYNGDYPFSKMSSRYDDGYDLLKIRRAGPLLR